MSPIAAFLLTVVGLSVAVISVQALKFQTCPSAGGTVLRVDIPQCRSDPCTLKQEQVIQIKAVIRAQRPATSIKTSISGTLEGRNLNLPENGTDVCAARLVQPPCPIVPGKVYTYTTDFKVQKYIPAKTIQVLYQGLGEGGKVMACAKLNVKIIKK